MPAQTARQLVTDSARIVRTAAERVSTASAETPAEIVGNRVISGISTIAIGGNIAAVLTYYWPPPEALHAHVTALVIFGWQSLVWGVTWWMGRRN